MKFARFALGRAKIVLFVVLVLAALGIHSYLVAPQSIFPTMSFSRIDVVAEAGDLPPERVRIAVTRPLADAIQNLPALTRVRATSAQGSGELVAEFDPHTDPRVDLQYVEGAISAVRASIPAAKNITAVIVTPNSEPVVSYALTSKTLSQAVLRQLAQRTIVPAFYGTTGLGRVLVIGGPVEEYHVDLDPSQLSAVGLSAGDVSTAIADANNVQAVGSTESGYQRQVLVIDAALHDVRSLGTIGIPLKNGTTIPLSSLGTIRLGVAPATVQAASNGTHAVILSAYGLAGADAVKMADAFKSRLESVRSRLPGDIAIVNTWDQTTLIVESQKSLRDAILLGALLAIVVIYFFLRSWRMTLVAAAVIPLAMAIAIFVLERTGQTLNLMSVGGLAVAVGLIIDDAIVVIENISRNLVEHPERSRPETVAHALSQLAVPMLASTLTTVVVFVPLALLSGVTGYFFRALAFTLSVSLLVSLALALFVAPIIANVLLKNEHGSGEGGGALARWYEPVLRFALVRKPLVFSGSALVLVVTAVLLSRLPSDFLPQMDEGKFEFKYTMPTGTTLAATDAAALSMERLVMTDAAVETESRFTGIDTNGYSPTQPNSGTVRVTLKSKRTGSYDEISGRIRDSIRSVVPAAKLDFHQILEDQLNDLSGAPSPVEVSIVGADQATLLSYGDKLAVALGKIPGIVDPFNGAIYDDPTRNITPQQARLAALGVASNDVADALASRTQGTVATQVPGAVQLIPVRVRTGTPLQAAGIGAQTLATKGGATSIGALAPVGPPVLASEINEQNGQRLVRVTANIQGVALSSVIPQIKNAIAQVGLAPGYSARIGGQYKAQQASFSEFLTVLAVAIMLVFTVMLATFGSFRLPLVILTAIPLALIGVALGLFVTHTPFNVSSFMGLLLLVGIVVKNGILLIDVANKQQLAGDDVTTALVTAGKKRLRPIVMTTLAAIGGLLPLALGIGSGSEMEKPLAIAVIGGLSTATLFTLVVIPVLYATFTGARRIPRPSARSVTAVTTALLLAVAVLIPQPASAQPAVTPIQILSFAQLALADAQKTALATSPEVRVARAVVVQQNAALAQARGAYGLSANVGYVETPQGSAEGTIASRVTSYGVGFTLGDLLSLNPLIAQAAASARQARIDAIVADRTERVRVIGLYFAALKARALFASRAALVTAADRQTDASRKRFSAGDVPRLDVIRAEVAAAKARADLANARAADANATDALARQCGISPAQLVATQTTVLDTATPLDPERALTLAHAMRAELRSSDENVRAATAGVRAAKRSGIPPVTLGAGYSRGVDGGFRIAGPTISAQMTIPLSGVASSRVAAQRTLVTQAEARREGVVRTLDLEVAAAARNVVAAIDAESATGAALRASLSELTATTTGYAGGASSSLEVASARSTYAQALNDDLSAIYDRAQSQAILALEVGS
ncbi:MAG: hypothetical protein NVS3B28_22550 [Candidatus Velthaea sp.]